MTFRIKCQLAIKIAMIGTRSTPRVSILSTSVTDFRLVLRFISTIARDRRVTRVRCLKASIRVRSSRSRILRVLHGICRVIRVLRTSAGLIFNRPDNGVNVNVNACVKVSARDRVNRLAFDNDRLISGLRLKSELRVGTRGIVVRPRVSFPVDLTRPYGGGLTDKGAYLSNYASFATACAINARTILTSGNGRLKVNVNLRDVVRQVITVSNDFHASTQGYITRSLYIMMVRKDARFTRFVSERYSFRVVVMVFI